MKNESLKKFLRRKAYERISAELAKFKERMLKQTPEKIFESSYEIDSYVCIYEQLVEKIEIFTEEQLRKLLQLPNVLGLFYDEWLSIEDSRNEELSDAVDMVVSKELNSNTVVRFLISDRKESGYGKII